MIALLKALDVLPGWLWALLCAGAISSLAVTSYQLKSERLAHQTTKSVYAAQVAAAERATREQSEKNRATEQELRDAQEAHAKEVATLHVDLDRSRANARAASNRMQDAANAAAARARAKCADSPAADLGTPAGDPIGVLGRVLSEIDDYAGAVADYADRSRVAGLACEREYESARAATSNAQ